MWTFCEGGSKMSKIKLHRLPVDSLKTLQKYPKKGQADLMIYGILPNPAYKIERIDVKVKEDIIQITPLASYVPKKIVIQMTVKFEEKCKVSRLNKGKEYNINLIGTKKSLRYKLKLIAE